MMGTGATVVAAGGDAPAAFQDRLRWYLAVSAYWFATSFKWFLVLQLMPVLVSRVVPPLEKDLWWGRIAGVGAVEAMIGPALFGALSDRTRSRFGRRRPFLAIGAALTAVALVFLGSATQLWMLFAGYFLLQIADDVATGPYAALVPDHVPAHRRGRASGILGQLQLTAQIAAAVLGFSLAGRPQAMFLAIAAVNVAGAAVVLRAWREREAEPGASGPGAAVFAGRPAARTRRLGDLWIAPWRNANFRWVWIARFSNALGFYVILSYLIFYLQDSVRRFELPGLTIREPFLAAVLLSMILSLTGSISAAVGGALADRVGRKRVIYAAGWLMFAALVPFAVVPDYGLIVALAPLFGAGYGAYLSVSWALAADTLPAAEDTGKDMGIWQMSVAAPQVIAGFAVSLLIFAGNTWRPGLGYTTAFLFAALCFLAGSLLIRFVDGVA